MRAMMLLVAAAACAACAPLPAGDPALVRMSTEIVERFGPSEVKVMRSPSGDWLDLTMRDRRFRKSEDTALDSAKAIAEYAASVLPADFRPDSIKVQVLVKSLDLWLYKTSTTISQTYPLAKLR